MSKVTQLVGGEAESRTQMCWSQSSFHVQLQPCLRLKPQRKRAGTGAVGLEASLQVLSSQDYCSHPKINPVTPDLLSYFFQYKPILWHLLPEAIACFLGTFAGQSLDIIGVFHSLTQGRDSLKAGVLGGWMGGWMGSPK